MEQVPRGTKFSARGSILRQGREGKCGEKCYQKIVSKRSETGCSESQTQSVGLEISGGEREGRREGERAQATFG